MFFSSRFQLPTASLFGTAVLPITKPERAVHVPKGHSSLVTVRPWFLPRSTMRSLMEVVRLRALSEHGPTNTLQAAAQPPRRAARM